jgi:hypothetical protein
MRGTGSGVSLSDETVKVNMDGLSANSMVRRVRGLDWGFAEMGLESMFMDGSAKDVVQ